MTQIKPIAIITLMCTLLFASCSESKIKEQHDELSDSTLVDTDTIKKIEEEEESDVSYKLPSALQIAYVFKKSGSAFDATLVNDKTSTSKYNSSNFKRATNFGVYSSDLAYCVFNKKFQESKDYLKACKEMGSTLGLNQAFEGDNTAQRFEKNISSEDSVIKIVGSIQLKTDLLFEQNKQKYITVIAFAGAWVESAYIANKVYEKDKNPKALASLLEQLWLGKTLLKALHAIEHKEKELPAFTESVSKLYSVYIQSAAIQKALEKDADIDFNKTKISDEELKNISESLVSLRNSITE